MIATREGCIYRDTSSGGAPLTLVGSAAVQDAKQMAAFRAYLAHPRDCDLCPEHTSQCDEAGRLWEAYRQVRG